jgi:type I restriction enzyme S subunit
MSIVASPARTRVTATSLKTLGDLCEERIPQNGPNGHSQFTYIDIGSIDNSAKRIVDPKSVVKEKAPSRAKQNVKTGDVLVSMTRPNLNAVALIPPELDGSVASTGFHVLRAKDTQPEWIYYAVQSSDFVNAMCKVVQGALYPAVRPKDIKGFSLTVPDTQTQRRIVAEIEKQFTRLDAGITALRNVQAKLKRYRAAVLKAACEGRLVPTEAELAKSRNSNFESGDKLLTHILNEHRKNWKGRGKYSEPAVAENPDRPLPSGWTWATIAQISTQVQYGSSAKTNENSGGVPVLRMGNIQDGKFDFDSLKYLPRSHDEFPELFLSDGDLLFNRTNSAELVGKTAVYKDSPKPCSFASYLIRVRLAEGCIPDFVSYFINSAFGRKWIAEVVSQQVGQANVNGTKLQALAIPLPPFAEQKRIVAEVERRLSVVEELEAIVSANLLRASRLRQSILQEAFSGELV